MSDLTVDELAARILARHYHSNWKELGISDTPVECCVICHDDDWPCDAVRLVREVQP